MTALDARALTFFTCINLIVFDTCRSVFKVAILLKGLFIGDLVCETPDLERGGVKILRH